MAATENSRIPMLRESMRGLRAKAEEENRLGQIDRIVGLIYSNAVYMATTTASTTFQCSPQQIANTIQHGGMPLAFDTRDKEEILEGVRKVFPDCSVNYKRLIQTGKDGKFIDISMVDSEVLLLINSGTPRDCIVIDWT